MSNMRETSRANYSVNGIPSENEIRLGCLQRIADATETMARRHNELLADAEREKRWRHEAEAQVAKLRRSNAALRGVIGRMKRGRK